MATGSGEHPTESCQTFKIGSLSLQMKLFRNKRYQNQAKICRKSYLMLLLLLSQVPRIKGNLWMLLIQTPSKLHLWNMCSMKKQYQTAWSMLKTQRFNLFQKNQLLCTQMTIQLLGLTTSLLAASSLANLLLWRITWGLGSEPDSKKLQITKTLDLFAKLLLEILSSTLTLKMAPDLVWN